MDPNEPHWRTNSSFSPPLPRRWDCRIQSDALSNGSNGAGLYGSSLSSQSKGSRSRVSSEQHPPNYHQHSVSDGVLSYFGSPENVQAPPRWTPPIEKYNFPEAGHSGGGSRPETSPFSQPSTGRHFAARISNSFGSPSHVSESTRWESSNKHPIFFPSRNNFSTRRSFISKPVYPLMFRNPVSDTEECGLVDPTFMTRLTRGESSASPFWPDRTSSLEHKFHKTLTDLNEMEASPEPSSSSRREGFRWSNASSYDMVFDGESIDIPENLEFENRRLPNNGSVADPKCGLCGRLLWQKSPWSSYRIVRSGDMPTAGVLSCSHVFHADCLDQTTPKAQSTDPPCPVCHKISTGPESSSFFSEPLQIALRSVRRNQGATVIPDGTGSSGNRISEQSEGNLRRNQSLMLDRGAGKTFLRNHFRKHFSLKGKAGKDLFGTKLFRRKGSSSDSRAGKNPVGSSRAGPR